jgi:hypothetical protein
MFCLFVLLQDGFECDWGMQCMCGGECGVLMTCARPMPCAEGSGTSDVVDIFDVTSGNWSTATLSQPRESLAATSLPNAGVAIFAGGCNTCFMCLFVLLQDGLSARGMLEWRGSWCVDDVCKTHALCS